jgi:hypothetical protein
MTLVLEDDFHPRTDGKAMFLQRPQPHWTPEEWALWWYAYEHELGHNHPDMIDYGKLLREKKIKKGFLSYVWNLLDDHRQEHFHNDEYLGRQQRLNTGRKLFLDTHAKFDIDPTADIRRLAAEALFAWDTAIRESWQPSLTGYGDKIVKLLTPQQQEWVTKLHAGDYQQTLQSGINAEEEYNLSLRIIKEVFNLDPEQEEKESHKQQPKQGEGKEGENKITEVDYGDLLPHNHDDKGSYSNMKIVYTRKYGEYFNSNVGEKIILIDMNKTAINYTALGYIDYRRGVDCIGGEGNNIAGKLRRLLQSKAAIKYQHGLTKGKISGKSLYRTRLINTAQQQKVFKTKVETTVMNAAVSLLVDGSGSMGGNKYAHAIRAAAMLNEALGVLRIPVEINVFSDQFETVKHALIKSFGGLLNTEQIIDRMCYASEEVLRGNSDGESIIWAYERLLRRRENKRILIVLSDGQPATDPNKGDCDWFSRKIVREIERMGLIDIIGIGIMEDSVKRIYNRNVVINSATELETTLLDIVEKRIL